MERFERIIAGYHGCTEGFARELLLGHLPISGWRPSENRWDWLGRGVYFWEHAPACAVRWAQDRYRSHGQAPAVIGAVIQLGRCFDLLDEAITSILADSYREISNIFSESGRSIPKNRGQG